MPTVICFNYFIESLGGNLCSNNNVQLTTLNRAMLSSLVSFKSDHALSYGGNLMAKPNWKKELSEVLLQKTSSLTLVSEKTGNEYTINVVPILKVLSIGTCEQTDDGKYRYSIVDVAHNLEYVIKAPNFVEVAFGQVLQFKNVRGGETSNGNGWYSAESVSLVEK